MFLQNKYTKWYFSIIENAKKQHRAKKQNIYYESHHIIPKCMNGIEEVFLTGKEHFICHLLLCRMLTGSNKHKMINALIKMAFSKSDGQERYTSSSFSLVRKLISEKNTEMFKGKSKSEKVKNNMKGRCGKWKRSIEYKQQISKRQKGKVLSWTLLENDDPVKLKIKEKLSEKMLGNKNPMKNSDSISKMKEKLSKKHWFTDGMNDVFVEMCPAKYTPGRSKNRKAK